MGRSPRCSKDGLNKGAWTAVEDEILINYVKSKGEGKWSNLAKETGLKRCGKSCRLRWMNYLRPDIKRGNISGDEEELITRLHKLLGNRWSLIAGRLPGRTDNEIKNYWNSYLAKKAKDSLPVARSNIDKKPVTGLRNVTRNDQANFSTPQQHMEDQNHDSKVATRPSTDTYQVTTEKSKLPSESSAGSPSPTSREDINSSDFILDLSSEDLCKMLDSDFAKLGDVDMNELNSAMEGDGGPLLQSEGMEKSLGGIECGQPTNLVSDFRPLFLESDNGWLGDDIDVLFSD